MLKRFLVLCFVCMMGLLLPTAVSQAILSTPPTLTRSALLPSHLQGACDVEFVGVVVEGQDVIPITGDVSTTVTIVDLTDGSQQLGVGTLTPDPGHDCPGFATIAVPPAEIIQLHTLAAYSSDGTTDFIQVQRVTGEPTALALLPDCGVPTADPGPVKLHVLFEEWPTNQSLTLYWDGDLLQSWQAYEHNISFSQAITRQVAQQPMTHTVTAVSGSGTTITQTFTVPCEQGLTADPPAGRDVYTSRTQDSGIIATSGAAVFGPDSCTSLGDPFSPLYSIWEPGFYSYHYRIQIPASYPHDIVRVELFNPDSINAPNPTVPFTIPRTQAAINAGLSPTTTGSCTSSQVNPCLVPTGELALYTNGTLPLERINPFFFWRLDENRTAGVMGVGCGTPASYNPALNTATLYQLYYFQDDGNATSRTNLAAYTGQTGDGVRDNGDHDTDMRWVSPGGGQSYDQPVFVPTDPGSPGNFEIDLNAELPNVITDPQTGDRYVYLDVTALSGASENSFEIWAGPPVYTSTIPSQVNARNLAALNNPHSHDSQGVTVFAIQNLPQNSNFNDTIEIPLTYVGPEYAGQEISVSLFDIDSGAAPPITFYFDTMAESDWSMTFAQSGVPDPDGEVRNCVPGTCNDMWITPPYHITIPGGNPAACDYGNSQNDPDCIPFPGGRLMVRYDGGVNDTYQWEVTPPTLTPNDPTVGCAAFPIAIHEGIYSVTPPGTGSNPFPDPGDFDPGTGGNQYPIPTYEQFFNHVPDVPLLEAQEGYVYRVWNGFGNGNFGWLKWNVGLNSSAGSLSGSLEWPGNSLDYTDYPVGDPNRPQGQAVPGSGFTWPVWGYIESGDPTDHQMQLNDWVAANTGVSNASYLEETLVGHINNQRVLRLLVWDIADVGGNGRFHISRFALFRLVGYNLSVPWLLLEFIGWDESCGQRPVAVTAVTLDGRYDAVAGVEYNFTAVANPTATLPITYLWQADGQTISHTGGLSDTLTFAWAGLGLQPITVTAVNGAGNVVDGRVVNILPATDRIPALYDGASVIYQSSANLALVKTASASVFGPDICTAYGDALSPFNSPWAPGSYTYHYLIHVPGDYPEDIVRIELFDPDSINQSGNNFTIARTAVAVSQGLSPTLTTSCSGDEAQQKNPCTIDTGELGLVLSGTLDYEQVNPLWLARVDENRGTGVSGQCGEPATYNATRNTQTYYGLFYWRQNPDGTIFRQDLATYTGQTGDGSRDNGGHLTDLQWVSPGATQSYDYPGNRQTGVPADPGSPGNFEIDLTSEVDGITVDPLTGDRYLRLDITSLSGASENSFQVWAGPPSYIDTITGQANSRNLQLLDDPQAHNPYGVTVYALGSVVQNWHLTGQFAEFPFTQFSSQIAGGTASISLFDSDSGAQPPITFFADSMAPETWSMAFAQPGIPDPDGQIRNCIPGNCENQWVTPAYAPTLPEEYPGGRLMVRYNGGVHDTTTWQMTGWRQAEISGPETGETNITYTFTADASYFLFIDPLTYTWEAEGYAPITHVGGITDEVTLTWPDVGMKLITVTVESGYFSGYYPQTLNGAHQITITEPVIIPPASMSLSAPATAVVGEPVTMTAVIAPTNTSQPIEYTWLADEQPPLVQTGGLMATAVFTWTEIGPKMITVTAVNEAGVVTATHEMVIEALQPDLTIIGPPQLLTPLPVGAHQPVSFAVTVANVGDVDANSQFFVDLFFDPTVVLTTSIPITESVGYAALSGLAAGESLVVTVTAQIGFANEPLTHTVYAWVDSLEQVGESDETNNVSVSLTVTDVHPLLAGVTLSGPALGLTGETYTFTAVTTPTTITDPITYTWFIDGAPTLTMTNGTAVTTTFTWPITGAYQLLVIADNSFNAVTDTHTIVITDTPITDLAIVGPLQLLTSGPIQPNQPLSFTVLIANVGNVPITSTFYVDVTLDPDNVLTNTVTAVPVNGLAVGENQLITILAPAGITAGAYSGDLFAVVDSWQQITEADETNNLSDPLVIDIAWRLYLPVIWHE